MRTIEEARRLAAQCMVRVKQRADYQSDNVHAVAYRIAEEKELVMRIVAARKGKRRAAKLD